VIPAGRAASACILCPNTSSVGAVASNSEFCGKDTTNDSDVDRLLGCPPMLMRLGGTATRSTNRPDLGLAATREAALAGAFFLSSFFRGVDNLNFLGISLEKHNSIKDGVSYYYYNKLVIGNHSRESNIITVYTNIHS